MGKVLQGQCVSGASTHTDSRLLPTAQSPSPPHQHPKDTYLPTSPKPHPSIPKGSEALWVALHGFAFALVALVVGLEHLSPTGLAAVLAGGGTYLLTLAEVAEHATLLEWA